MVLIDKAFTYPSIQLTCITDVMCNCAL